MVYYRKSVASLQGKLFRHIASAHGYHNSSHGRGCGVGRSLGIGVGRGVEIGVGVGVASDMNGAATLTPIGEPVLKKPIVALLEFGG